MFEDIFAFLRQHFHGVGTFYLVGGAPRDFLLGRKIFDLDVATDLTPEEIRAKLPEADYTFSRTGTVNLSFNGLPLTITTFRKEGEYSDSRHPSRVDFIKDYRLDSGRRDFTINAIYFGGDGAILDPQGGLSDLSARLLRAIGDADKKLGEDPLRILRAARFKLELGFEYDEKLYSAINRQLPKIALLKPQKVRQELEKVSPEERKELLEMLGRVTFKES